MKTPAKFAVAVVVVGALGAGGFFGFEYFDHRGFVKDAKRSCGTLDTQTSGLGQMLKFPLPVDQKLLRVENQGKTTLLVASAPGERKDIVKVRDAVVAVLTSAGYTKKGTDQEPGYEAEAQFGGVADGSIKVRPLCSGRLEIRYTLRH